MPLPHICNTKKYIKLYVSLGLKAFVDDRVSRILKAVYGKASRMI